jgi:hypothetical protein
VNREPRVLYNIIFDAAVFSRHDNNIIMIPQFLFMAFFKPCAFNVSDTNMTAEKYFEVMCKFMYIWNL